MDLCQCHRWSRSLALLGLVVILGGSLSAFAEAPQQLPPGTVSGKVVDFGGKPIANARAWIETHDESTKSLRVQTEGLTDAEGRFRLGPMEPVYRSGYPLMIEAPGFAMLTMPTWTLTVYPGHDHECLVVGQALACLGCPREPRQAKACPTKNLPDAPRTGILFQN